MTIVDSPTQTPEVDIAQLLFEEARQRRRRRWLISGITVLFILVALGITLIVMAGRKGTGSVQRPIAPPPSAQPVASPNATFSVRPVLCYAPPFAPTSGSAASPGPLPPCAPSLTLTAANLHVTPNGYTGAISPRDTDSQFAAYSSTSPKYDKPSETVLLPGSTSSQTRYVLGPAGLTGSAIRSASAQRVAGQWVVNINLNGHGAAQWDNLSREQFHAFIGIDLDGKVISAAIIQPTQASFSSFDGQMQIAGGLNRHQAEALAARL
jgi:hypothetical protein